MVSIYFYIFFFVGTALLYSCPFFLLFFPYPDRKWLCSSMRPYTLQCSSPVFRISATHKLFEKGFPILATILGKTLTNKCNYFKLLYNLNYNCKQWYSVLYSNVPLAPDAPNRKMSMFNIVSLFYKQAKDVNRHKITVQIQQ